MSLPLPGVIVACVLCLRSLAVSALLGYAQNAVRHKSNAEQMIADVPVVKVNAKVAVCDGGAMRLQHHVCGCKQWMRVGA